MPIKSQKQRVVHAFLKDLNTRRGIDPSVRSLADRMEEIMHGSERWDDKEVRGYLDRLAKAGYVEQYDDPNDPSDPHRWRVIKEADE